jgi:hypothetical protein
MTEAEAIDFVMNYYNISKIEDVIAFWYDEVIAVMKLFNVK